MNAEFQWWLLILGMVIGGALVYLVLADIRADDEEPEWLGDEPPETQPADDPPDPTGPADAVVDSSAPESATNPPGG